MSSTTSAVVDALKASALAKIRGASTPKPAAASGEVPDMKVSASASKVPTATAWPSVMCHSGDQKMFSELFPEYAGTLLESQPDFAMPWYGEHAWPEWMRAYIPAGSDYRSDTTLLYDAALAFAAGSVTHLVGWPGTGKSNGLPVLIAHRLGLPLLRLGLNKKGMMLDDLIGREAIKQTDAGMITGHKDGVLVPWITEPCIILADEFCRANTEISNGLMSLMERNGCLIIENRENPIVRRHEHAWIIASDNAKGLGDQASRMVGTDVVDAAVLDRFEVTLEVDYLPHDEQMMLVRQWYPGFPEPMLTKLVSFGMLIQQGYKKETLPLSFSPRTLKETARYACLHRDMKQAVRKCVLTKYAEESDVQAIREFYRTAFGVAL